MDNPVVNILSLFSGGAGLDIGLERALRRLGIASRLIAYVEREAYAAAVLGERMEEARLAPAPIWTDVTTFDGRPFRGLVDIICGGFPCQDLSVAGKRAGIDGERSGLWSEFARIVGEVRPALVFAENVPGLLADGAMERVAGDLAEMGFVGRTGCLRASDVGAPHRRERVFILAMANAKSGHGGPRFSHARRSDAEGTGRAVDDSCSQRRQQVAGSTYGDEGADEGRATQHGDEFAGAEQAMADATSSRWSWANGTGEQECGPFPPGPSDVAAWAYVLERWPELAPAIEPTVRELANGMGAIMAHRVDALRLVGNGVVPAQAEAAFLELWQRG